MKFIALFSFVALSVLAADNTSYIPTDVSSSCASFLTTLDSNSDLQACLTPLVKATSSLSGSTTPSSSVVSSAISSVCSSSTASACSDVLFRTTLSSFYTSCQSDLSTENTVKALYDTLYTLAPFRAAVCQQDSSGKSCLSSIVDSTTAKTSSLSSSTGLPNATYFAQSNIPFLFLLPTTSSSVLCSDCAQNIMKAYTSFEIALPYGPGIKQSVLLGQQSDLWNAMSTGCSSGVVANAGAAPSSSASLPGTAGGALSGARSNARISGGLLGGAVALVAALAAF